MKKKVLFLVNHDIVIFNFRLELVERLLEEGHEVVVSSPYGERIDDLVSLGCEYHPIEISRHGINPIADIALYLEYKRLISMVSPDVVFSYTVKPNIYGGMACAALNLPYVANITGLGTALENEGILQKILTMLYRYAFRKVQRVFCQNEENLAFVEKHRLATDKLSLIPGSGVNLDRFSVQPYPNSDTIEFAFISRIMKEKGIVQYLDAAKTIRAKHPKTRFHVYGFCEQVFEGELKRLEEKDIIIYHGLVKDMSSIYRQMNCIVHPTYYPEGISNVLLEAAASARPIITTDRSGCREVVEDGVNGFIVRQKDSQDLIEKIEIFLAFSWQQKRAMGLAGRGKVEREFDRKTVIDLYIREMNRKIENDENAVQSSKFNLRDG